MSNQFPDKNILDARYSSMSAPSTQQGKWAAAFWGVKKGEITLTIFTNDETDKSTNPNEKGMINARMSPRVFGSFVGAIRQAINATEPFSYAYTHEGYKFFGKQRSEKPMPLWQLVVKRDDKGRISFMLMDAQKDSRPRIPFVFEPPRDGKVLGRGGQPMDEGEISRLFAQGFLDTTVPMINRLCVELYEHPQPKQGQGNNQGGYQNRNNNNYNQGQQRTESTYTAPPASSDYDDELPF